MTKSYSLDLRKRVARFVEVGHSCHAAARHFDVSVAFLVRLMAAYRATGSLAPRPEGGWRYSKLDPHRDFLLGLIEVKDDISLVEMQERLAAERGIRASVGTIWTFLDRAGLTFKKRPPTRPSRSAQTF